MISGNYLDQKSAARIGLIPEKLLKKTVSVGNAAQKGAIDTAYIYEDHGSKIETKILNKDIKLWVLMGVSWNLRVVLICISLVTKDVGHFFFFFSF